VDIEELVCDTLCGWYGRPLTRANLQAIQAVLQRKLEQMRPAGVELQIEELQLSDNGVLHVNISANGEFLSVGFGGLLKRTWRDELVGEVSKMGKMVEVINMSEDTVKVPELNIFLEPQQAGQVDLAYTLPHRGEQSVLEMLAPQLVVPRVECPVCGIIVGQRGPGGEKIVEWDHKAECGLRCEGYRLYGHGRAIAATEFFHSSVTMCPRCCPRTCPNCNGSGLDPAGGWEQEPDGAFASNRSKSCSRCRRTGKVPGKELW
jgi:hypothetical protein